VTKRRRLLDRLCMIMAQTRGDGSAVTCLQQGRVRYSGALAPMSNCFCTFSLFSRPLSAHADACRDGTSSQCRTITFSPCSSQSKPVLAPKAFVCTTSWLGSSASPSDFHTRTGSFRTSYIPNEGNNVATTRYCMCLSSQ
jgi:hypothetical protein